MKAFLIKLALHSLIMSWTLFMGCAAIELAFAADSSPPYVPSPEEHAEAVMICKMFFGPGATIDYIKLLEDGSKELVCGPEQDLEQSEER